jgi:uncharacterized delta-60 repeat protein
MEVRVMHSAFRFTLIIAIIGLIIAGCAGHNSQPISPDETISPQDVTGNADVSDDSSGNSHYLLSSGLIYINTENPDDPIFEIIPAREEEIHFNVLKFLEVAPCNDCFRIVGFNFPEPGFLNLDIRIDHPFTDLLYSVFDFRCVIMFDGSHEFPSIGKTTSDPSIGEGSLLSADGFTALYNGSTITAPVGEYQKYFPGKLSTELIPNSDINGYIYFRSDDPANNRNAFYANSYDVKTFSMKLPADIFVIGYAVDASWAPPISEPVDDPLTDFDLNANCTEPWKIEVHDIGPGLTVEGGTTKLQIDVYDWQGKSTHHAPVIECPEIFDGFCSAIWTSDGDGYSRYEANISNTNLAAIGNYMCLIGVMANENDPVGKPWLDLTAYQIFSLDVGGGSLIWAKRAGGESWDEGYGITTLSDNSSVVTGGFQGSATFGPGEPNETVLTSAGGYDIFIARYNPDGTLAWAKRAGGATDAYFEEGHGITTLSDNSTVVTGWFNESATFGPDEPNETILTSDGGYDIFIARYNPDGTLAWAKHAGVASDDDYPFENNNGVTTLSDNSTVVTGCFSDLATFGSGEPNETVLTSAGGFDIFIARYNSDGTLAWAKRAGGNSDLGMFYDNGNGITTLSDNSTVVTGFFYVSATFGPGEPNQTVLTSAGWGDIFIARYNPDGTLVWVKHAGGDSSDYGYGITTLSDNSTVVTGYFYESATFGAGEPNQTILTSTGVEDIFTARYNPDGTLAWAKHAGGISSADCGNGITALSDNSTVVTGVFSESATFGPSEPNQTVLTSSGIGNIFIARYNPDGTLAWAKRAGGAFYDYDVGYGITTFSDNSTVVTGGFSGSATFGPGEPNETVLTSAGEYDFFVARFNP